MKVILEISDSFADVLSITAIKSVAFNTNVYLTAVELNKGDHIVFGNKGEIINQFFESEIYR